MNNYKIILKHEIDERILKLLYAYTVKSKRSTISDLEKLLIVQQKHSHLIEKWEPVHTRFVDRDSIQKVILSPYRSNLPILTISGDFLFVNLLYIQILLALNIPIIRTDEFEWTNRIIIYQMEMRTGKWLNVSLNDNKQNTFNLSDLIVPINTFKLADYPIHALQVYLNNSDHIHPQDILNSTNNCNDEINYVRELLSQLYTLSNVLNEIAKINATDVLNGKLKKHIVIGEHNKKFIKEATTLNEILLSLLKNAQSV